MSGTKAYKTVIIFSKIASARDRLRNSIMANGGTAFCFETETTCFDNLESINPDVVLTLTDSESHVWRFAFAIQALGANSALLVLSDVLKSKSFNLLGLDAQISCIPALLQGKALTKAIDEIITGKPDPAPSNGQPLYIGQTETVKTIRSMVPELTSAQEPLLITGEPGTGKELLARIIACSTGDASTIIKVNCAEFGSKKETLAELCARQFIDKKDKLFQNDKIIAQPITILLDKINTLHEDSQGEILLLLDGEFKSIFDVEVASSNGIRFIATSEEKLESMVLSGKFRKDLYYRLNVIPIHIPPLRERVKDIPLLLDYFIIETCAKTKKSFIIPTDSVKESLCIYGWPGNVDELKKLMQRLAVTGDESFVFAKNGIEPVPKYSHEYLLKTIDMAALPTSMDIKSMLSGMRNISLKLICDKFASKTEKKLMQKALESTNWNRKKAAALLNISYKSMLNKIKMYEIM